MIKVKKIVKKISASTTLEKILGNLKSEKVLHKFGVPCLGCPMAKFEMTELKIGDICKSYGIDLKKLLIALNKK